MPVNELRSLFAENAAVQKARNEHDLLERLIMDPDGTDLRAVVSKISALVEHSSAEYNLLHDRMQSTMERRKEGALSTFMHQKLAHEDLAVLRHMFACALENNPNDDHARMAQLTIVFMALTHEVDTRCQLVAQPQHVDRAALAANGAQTHEAVDLDELQARERRENANLIQRDPLTLFLKNDARRLMTQFCDSVIDLNTYVSECVSAYMSYKRAIDPRIAYQYYADKKK